MVPKLFDILEATYKVVVVSRQTITHEIVWSTIESITIEYMHHHFFGGLYLTLVG